MKHQTFNKQKGFTLFELMVVIVIIGVISTYAASWQKREIDKQVGSIAAEHLSKISKASNAYIRDNYSAIMSLATSTQPAIIRVSDLISQNYLQPGTSTNNAYQQATCALVLQPNPGQLTGMVVTEGGKALDDFTLSSMVTKVGAAGGGIYTDTPAAIIGSRGGWSVNHANYSNANHLGQDCAGNAGTVDMDVGHAHVALWFENNDLTAGFLYREAVPARPELNRMATNLDMDTFDINNAGDIDGASLTTTGKVDAQDGFDVDGTSVIDSSRNLVNIAAITASGKIDTSGTMEANTFSVNGTSVINSSRNLVNIGSISASSTISTSGSIRPGTATEGNACTTTGDVRRDSTGMLLSCQSGSWTAVGGNPSGTPILLQLHPTNSSTTRSWQNALDYCRGLGNGWRLPSISEIKIIRDQTGWSTSAWYWSSTRTYGDAWLFRPSDSHVDLNGISSSYRARCVRSVIQ